MSVFKLTQLQQQEIGEVLSQFGLNEKDQKVYLVLLQLGQTTLTPLARAVDLKTTTVQSVVKRLVDRGLVSASKRGSRHVYKANDPLVLKKILERQVEEMKTIIPFLQTLKEEPSVSPKIRVYYRDRINDIFMQGLESKNKLIYEIVSAKDFQKVIGEKLHFTRRRLKHGVRLKSLRVEEHEIKKYSKKTHERELREAKFLPRELTFRSSMMFWDDTVAFVSTKDEGIAWTVESKVLREMFQQLFDLLWSVSRRMETAEEDV